MSHMQDSGAGFGWRAGLVSTFEPEDIRRHRATLFRVVNRHVREPWTSEDILQETFARYVRAREATPIHNVGAWLRFVAMNLVRDHFRARRLRTVEDLSEDMAGDDDPPDEATMHQERIRLFSDALNTLPPLRRDVFIRRKLHGQTAREVAQTLSISMNSVDQHVARALITLQDEVSRTSRCKGGGG